MLEFSDTPSGALIMGGILLILLGVFRIGEIFYVKRREKRDWNGGFCSICHSRWIHFGCTSRGKRGYICRNCDRDIIISPNIAKHLTIPVT